MIRYKCKVLVEGNVNITSDNEMTKEEIEKMLNKYGLNVFVMTCDIGSIHDVKLVEIKNIEVRK